MVPPVTGDTGSRDDPRYQLFSTCTCPYRTLGARWQMPSKALPTNVIRRRPASVSALSSPDPMSRVLSWSVKRLFDTVIRSLPSLTSNSPSWKFTGRPFGPPVGAALSGNRPSVKVTWSTHTFVDVTDDIASKRAFHAPPARRPTGPTT